MELKPSGHTDRVARFYDDLSVHYHLLLEDWDRAVVEQGALLDRLIAYILGPGPRTILDAACGIGTQAIGLALRGHKVHGTDLSPAAILRARREAQRFGVRLPANVADLRMLSGYVAGPFDVVCAMDNALPHLPDDEDLRTAVAEMAAVLAPGGLFLASVRDYDAIADERPRATPVKVYDDLDVRRILFQVWDWRHDGKGYRLSQHILLERGPEVEAMVFYADYWVVRRARLAEILTEAGLIDVRWLEPAVTGFYQPIIAARTAVDN
jgi:SAM-dependent methyltransferase